MFDVFQPTTTSSVAAVCGRTPPPSSVRAAGEVAASRRPGTLAAAESVMRATTRTLRPCGTVPFGMSFASGMAGLASAMIVRDSSSADGGPSWSDRSPAGRICSRIPARIGSACLGMWSPLSWLRTSACVCARTSPAGAAPAAAGAGWAGPVSALSAADPQPDGLRDQPVDRLVDQLPQPPDNLDDLLRDIPDADLVRE